MTRDNRFNDTDERDDVALAELLRMAGERRNAPADVEDRVYEAVRTAWRDSLTTEKGEQRVYRNVRREWQRNSARPARPRWLMPLALAASVLVATIVVLRAPVEIPATVSIATVIGVSGDGLSGLPAVGTILHEGDRLQTGTGSGMTLQTAAGASLRIDENTTLALLRREEFRLDRGRVYADTGDLIFRDKGLVIETLMGTVTDVGTQFAVDVVGSEALSIAVREGRVDLSHGSSDIVTVAGEIMTLERGGDPQVSQLAANDPYWDWAIALAPHFDIDNQSLLDLLRWASRETGRELVFEDPELRLAAMRTDLHGSIGDLAPMAAVESVLATTSFNYRIDERQIIIER